MKSSKSRGLPCWARLPSGSASSAASANPTILRIMTGSSLGDRLPGGCRIPIRLISVLSHPRKLGSPPQDGKAAGARHAVIDASLRLAGIVLIPFVRDRGGPASAEALAHPCRLPLCTLPIRHLRGMVIATRPVRHRLHAHELDGCDRGTGRVRCRDRCRFGSSGRCPPGACPHGRGWAGPRRPRPRRWRVVLGGDRPERPRALSRPPRWERSGSRGCHHRVARSGSAPSSTPCRRPRSRM